MDTPPWSLSFLISVAWLVSIMFRSMLELDLSSKSESKMSLLERYNIPIQNQSHMSGCHLHVSLCYVLENWNNNKKGMNRLYSAGKKIHKPKVASQPREVTAEIWQCSGESQLHFNWVLFIIRLFVDVALSAMTIMVHSPIGECGNVRVKGGRNSDPNRLIQSTLKQHYLEVIESNDGFVIRHSRHPLSESRSL